MIFFIVVVWGEALFRNLFCGAHRARVSVGRPREIANGTSHGVNQEETYSGYAEGIRGRRLKSKFKI
jgi:hypothetical protein